MSYISAEDRFNLTGVANPEGATSVQQGLAAATGWPVTWLPILRDGIGIEPEIFGNALQTQTVAVGDGSKTTWCSQAKFCANPSVAGTLLFNAASLSGAQITAKIDNGSGAAGNTLTLGIGSRGSAWFGALEPGAVLTDLTGNITGSPVLQACLTGCIPITSTSPTIPAFCGGPCYPNIQTWTISGAAQLVAQENMRADTGSTPWPMYVGQGGFPFFTSFGQMLVKAGTFKILVNGTVVCQDTTLPMTPYNNQGGNCTTVSNGLGLSVSSSFEDFMTGDYSVTFSSAPAANAAITASWTSLVSPDNGSLPFERPGQYDFFGTPDLPNVGPVTSLYSKSPGGVSAHIFTGGQSVETILLRDGFPFGLGYSQAISWLYDTRFPTLPGVSANAPVLFGYVWGIQGPVQLGSSAPGNAAQGESVLAVESGRRCNKFDILGNCWERDGRRDPQRSLTLTSVATGSVPWEGMVVGCAPFSLTCALGTGAYIQSLTSGTWAQNGIDLRHRSTVALAQRWLISTTASSISR